MPVFRQEPEKALRSVIAFGSAFRFDADRRAYVYFSMKKAFEKSGSARHGFVRQDLSRGGNRLVFIRGFARARWRNCREHAKIHHASYQAGSEKRFSAIRYSEVGL